MDGNFGTIGVPFLERAGGGFTVWRQTVLRHLEAPSLAAVGGDMLFQQNMQLPSLCHLALPESGFSGNNIRIVGTPTLRQMPAWLAVRAGVAHQQECTGHRPVLVRNAAEYHFHAGNATLVRATAIGPLVVSWSEISNSQLATLLQSKTDVGSLFIERGTALTDVGAALRRVETILGPFTVAGCTNLAVVELPALTAVHGTLTFTGNRGHLTISAPRLTVIGAELRINANLLNISLPSLAVVNGSLRLDVRYGPITAAAMSAGLRSLRFVGGYAYFNIWMQGGAFELAALQTVGGNGAGSLGVYDGQFDAVHFPRLTNVTGAFTLWRQIRITQFSMPRITNIAGAILFQDLQSLPSLCNFTLPQEGASTEAGLAIRGCLSLNRMEPWVAEAAGISTSYRVCPTRQPTALPTTSPSPMPTTSPTTPPTGAPTAAPTRHACNDGTHGCNNASQYGICEQIGAAGHRCSCANTHRCSDGTCATAGHTCVWITGAPTPAPTLAPTAIPTSFPSALPTKGPTVSPTRLPTLFPTDAPTLFPTDAPSPTQPSGSASTGSDASDGSSSGVVVPVVVGMVALLVIVIAAAAVYVAKATAKGKGGGDHPPSAFDNPLYDAAAGSNVPAYETALGSGSTGCEFLCSIPRPPVRPLARPPAPPGRLSAPPPVPTNALNGLAVLSWLRSSVTPTHDRSPPCARSADMDVAPGGSAAQSARGYIDVSSAGAQSAGYMDVAPGIAHDDDEEEDV